MLFRLAGAWLGAWLSCGRSRLLRRARHLLRRARQDPSPLGLERRRPAAAPLRRARQNHADTRPWCSGKEVTSQSLARSLSGLSHSRDPSCLEGFENDVFRTQTHTHARTDTHTYIHTYIRTHTHEHARPRAQAHVSCLGVCFACALLVLCLRFAGACAVSAVSCLGACFACALLCLRVAGVGCACALPAR